MSHILHKLEHKDVLGSPIIADIYRYDPSVDTEPRMKQYVIPYHKRMSILTLLREVYENIDASIAFRNQQCGRGICGTCHCRIGKDRKQVKGCMFVLQPGSHIEIYPSKPSKVIRDLVVDQ